MTLPEFLIKERLRMGLKQHEAAKRIGVSQVMVSRYELGLSLPTFKSIRGYSKLYGVSADVIVNFKIY